MAEFVLKDWYGKDQTFDHDKIFVKNAAGELIQFTQGAGGSADVRYVTFMSHDGTAEHGKKAVAVGDDCADPIARGVFDTPTRESTAQYNYTHYGWATTPNGAADSNWNKSITEDKTVYANFASAVRYYTITYYDDDGTTVLKTESLAYGATPSYTPKKEGYNFDAWVPAVSTVTGDASYTANWVAKVGFDAATWAEIAEIAESGNASSAFTIGETRTETINGVDVGLKIIGFNHDDLSDGSGKAGLTIMAYKKVPFLKLDERKTYADDVKWSNCDLRTYLNGEYFATFPEDLQSVIKAVNKISDGGHKSNTLVTTSDKVWIPSYEETKAVISSHVSLVTAGQGTKYAGITTSGVTPNISASGYNDYFCTRTVAFEGTSSNGPGSFFTMLSSSAYATYTAGYNNRPIAFCFCI